MNKLEKSLLLVKKHFQETSDEKLRNEFDRFHNLNSNDITIEEYFANFEENHSFLRELEESTESDFIFSDWSESKGSPIKISEKLTSDLITQMVSSNKNEFTEEKYTLKAA